VKKKSNPSRDEKYRYTAGLEKYVRDEMTNLNGFELLDDARRYDVAFEGGWKPLRVS